MTTANTKHLIDPEPIPLLDMLPPLNPTRESLPQIRAMFNAMTAQMLAVSGQSFWPIPKISEPACYGRQKREGNPSTCLNWRKGMREGKHEAQAEDESYLARVSVQIRPH